MLPRRSASGSFPRRFEVVVRALALLSLPHTQSHSLQPRALKIELTRPLSPHASPEAKNLKPTSRVRFSSTNDEEVITLLNKNDADDKAVDSKNTSHDDRDDGFDNHIGTEDT